MRAAVHYRFGSPDVVQIADLPTPVPKDNEMLVKVRAASLNPANWRLIDPPLRPLLTLLLPKVKRLGTDVAGVVEAVGNKVTRFKPGDAVWGACRGSLAEYAAIPESKLVMKPEALSFEEVASAPVAALTALQGLRDHGHLQAGQTVLINGAAGGVGTFSVQFARVLGAAQVTGVTSPKNVELVRSLGATRVIDYTREDFAQDQQRYDVILDNVGNRSLADFKRVLKPGGRCITAGAPKDFWPVLTGTLKVLVLSKVGKTFDFFIAKLVPDDLKLIGEVMATGKVTPVIDRRYKLDEIVEAFRYALTGHARGKLIVNLD